MNRLLVCVVLYFDFNDIITLIIFPFLLYLMSKHNQDCKKKLHCFLFRKNMSYFLDSLYVNPL